MAKLCQQQKLANANITLGNMCGTDQDKHVRAAAALLHSLTRRETEDTHTQAKTKHETGTKTHTGTTSDGGKEQHDKNKAKAETETGNACEDETGAQGTWAVVQGKRVCTATSSTPAMRAWPLEVAAQTPHAWALA
ncbi:hypothetical protein ERJ75_000287000 [Trypanosoma vivax]|nr:hypothetical protein ERJ75_000287000 [Trypanosoma vivax]